ncbi:hypothetical protein [Hymenobacter glaciei]|uniref:hypothetical protein n=1 Tax=Hymenobacter glaciei TaxID=877209 RepID=UPI0031E7D1FF
MNRRKRLCSAFVDHFTIALVGVPVAMLIDKLIKQESIGIGVLCIIYANKDFLQGRSIAKRILGFVVVNRRTKSAASPLRCFIRNITILIWPIEVIMLLINPARRLGDYLAGTECVDCSNQASSNDLVG